MSRVGEAYDARVTGPNRKLRSDGSCWRSLLAAATTGSAQANALADDSTRTQRNLKFEHAFFSGIAGVILISVFVGFAQTYYLHGIVRVPAFKTGLGPPFPAILHVHAVLFSSWIVLLVIQTSLVAAHRVDLHRRLGLAIFGVAGLMVIVGLAATCVSMTRFDAPADPKLKLPLLQLVDLTVFSTLVYFGYRCRSDSAAHKRLMLIATITLLDAAFARWPVLTVGKFLRAEMCCYALLLLIASYDLFSMKRIHLATLWGGALLILSHHPILSFLRQHVTGHQLALYMQSLGRHLS